MNQYLYKKIENYVSQSDARTVILGVVKENGIPTQDQIDRLKLREDTTQVVEEEHKKWMASNEYIIGMDEFSAGRFMDVKRDLQISLNSHITNIFEHISQILQIQGDDLQHALAYTRAADAVECLTRKIFCFNEDPKPPSKDLRGIGEKMALKISEILETGKLEYHEALKKSPYAPLVDFLNIPGVKVKTARKIYDMLAINTFDALEQAAIQGKLRMLPGIGPKREANILKWIQENHKKVKSTGRGQSA